VADILNYVDMDLSDPLIAALAELRHLSASSPIELLARCPQIDTATKLLEARAERFRARGCRQLSDAAWTAETAILARDLEQKLANRYFRHLTAK
jgi:hypothetical protein